MEFPYQTHLYLYNRNHQRIKDDHPTFYFFGSGSTGNSVYLKPLHILIDMGFPNKKYMSLSPYFWYQVRYVFLTHEHSDHLNTTTLFHILKLYPHLRFLISKRMYERLISPLYGKNFTNNADKRAQEKQSLKTTYHDRFIIFEPDVKSIPLYQNDVSLDQIEVDPHMVSHGDITNVAYEIKTKQHHILYSSDLDHVFAPQDNQLSLPLDYDHNGNVKLFDDPFDLIFLEANYDEDILHRFLQEHPEDAHANGNLRHISEQETWRYIKYTLAPNGIFIPLHASSQFGTLIQDIQSD